MVLMFLAKDSDLHLEIRVKYSLTIMAIPLTGYCIEMSIISLI